MSLEDRKQLLVLACEADRVAWCNACRPTPPQPAQHIVQLLTFLEPIASLLPGWPGRWMRKTAYLMRLGRQFGILGS